MKKHALSLLLILTLTCTSVPAFAKSGFENVKEYVLDNGLKVLLLEEHKAPVAVFQIWYKVGSRYEPYQKAGISHMLEHMMFRGSKRFGPKTFSRIVQRYGGSENAFTSQDYTAFFQTFASDRIWLSFDLESDRMTGLLLKDKAFQAERKVVEMERRMRTDNNPEAALEEQTQAAAYVLHPYHWPIIGWMDNIENYTIQDVRKHYKTYYMPNNATIVVVGDIDADKTIGEIKKWFGPIPKGPEPPKVVVQEPAQHGERRVYLKKEAELPTVDIMYHAPNLRNTDAFALDVLSTILSGGQSARLYKSLVYDKQIAQYASADYDEVTKDPETFSFSAGVMPGKTADEVENALYAEIKKVQSEPVTDRELQKAKNQIEAAFIMGQDSDFYRAMLLGQYESVASWKLLNSYLGNIRKVTKEDVQRVAKTYLTQDNSTVGTLIPLPVTHKMTPAPTEGGPIR
ncbi:MAG: pitrilysin family protein [Nitrospirota bacterium]